MKKVKKHMGPFVALSAKAGWTHFWDMHSGGDSKEKWNHIYIEAPEEEAKIVFYNRFGHNPERVSCTCCGQDYSISFEKDLDQLTGYHRNLEYGYVDSKGNRVEQSEAWIPGKGLQKGYVGGYIEGEQSSSIKKIYGDRKKALTLEEYAKSKDVLFIYSKDIKDSERIGEVPEQGYVWAG